MPESRTPDLRWPELWRRRDDAIFAFLALFTATRTQIGERFFTGATLEAKAKKAGKWLVRKRKRKRVAVVGIALRHDTGRPEHCFGRRCKSELELAHELCLTDFAIHYPEATFSRDAAVRETQADALMIYQGETCWIEIDHSGHMNRKQMRAKWVRYQGVKGWILVVAMTESRMEKLRRDAELVKDVALFTTFKRLKAGQSWLDYAGQATEI